MTAYCHLSFAIAWLVVFSFAAGVLAVRTVQTWRRGE